MVQKLVDDVEYVTPRNVRGIMYPEPSDKCITWKTAQHWLEDPSENAGGGFGYLWDYLVNEELESAPESASLIMIDTSWDPFSSKSREFIMAARESLAQSEAAQEGVTYRLVQGSVPEFDTAETILSRFWVGAPIVVGTLCLCAALAFRAPLQSVRMLLGLAGMFAVYGIAIGIWSNQWIREWGIDTYDPETNRTVPVGLYWYTVLVSVTFNISFSFSMEFTLFARIIEHRKRGYSTIAAVIRSLHQQGNSIIFGALITSLILFSIVLSDVPCYEQLGFLVIFGVLTDAFIVRALLMPALITLFGEWNWWPFAGRYFPKNNLLNCYVDESTAILYDSGSARQPTDRVYNWGDPNNSSPMFPNTGYTPPGGGPDYHSPALPTGKRAQSRSNTPAPLRASPVQAPIRSGTPPLRSSDLGPGGMLGPSAASVGNRLPVGSLNFGRPDSTRSQRAPKVGFEKQLERYVQDDPNEPSATSTMDMAPIFA